MNEMDVGGVSRVLIDTLNKFDYNKYCVTLWINQGRGEMQSKVPPTVKIKPWGAMSSKALLWEQVRTINITGTLRGVWYRLLCRLSAKSNDINSIYAIKSLPRFLDEQYDCVICYQGVSGVVIANALYRISGKKNILWVHGSHNRSKKVLRRFSKIYNEFDQIFCVSNAIENEFAKQFPATKSKLQVCYNLINSNLICTQASSNISIKLMEQAIVTVGRLSPEKGQQMVPRTARLLLDAGYDIHWYLVGDGSLRETVESEIEKYDVSDRVILLGTQMNPYPYIKNCDIYVQPSLSEGWCLTVQEARILQKPIVTTPLPVMHEQIISGENGLIAEDTTPEALAESIKLLLDHPELREKFVENLSHEVCDNSGELQKLYDFIES